MESCLLEGRTAGAEGSRSSGEPGSVSGYLLATPLTLYTCPGLDSRQLS